MISISSLTSVHSRVTYQMINLGKRLSRFIFIISHIAGVTSKNIAGVVLDAFPVLQFGNALNLHSIECQTRTQDPNSVITSLQTSMDYQKEVTLDELRHKLNHSKGQEHLVWIVKILYKNIKYRPFSHKCYLIGEQPSSM